jgi:SAM-dependent methyltransferase
LGVGHSRDVTAEEHEQVVRRSFTRQVGLFSGPDSPFAQRPAGTVSWLEPLDAEMVALDVACGAAHAAEAVAPRVREVVGIDLTPSLLELGAQRLRDAGVTNVLLQEANAESLPFVDGSFDLVFCRSSLHHFADPHRAVTEMVRTCRTGGRVVLADLIAPSAEERDTFDDLHRLIDPSHVRSFVERELAALLAGLTLTYGETLPIRLPIDIALTEQSERDRVLAALRDDVAGGQPTGFDPVEEDCTFVVSFTTCIVHGTRD